jgi:hypothetical protein
LSSSLELFCYFSIESIDSWRDGVFVRDRFRRPAPQA